MPILLWFLGVPIVVIVLLYLLNILAAGWLDLSTSRPTKNSSWRSRTAN